MYHETKACMRGTFGLSGFVPAVCNGRFSKSFSYRITGGKSAGSNRYSEDAIRYPWVLWKTPIFHNTQDTENGLVSKEKFIKNNIVDDPWKKGFTKLRLPNHPKYGLKRQRKSLYWRVFERFWVIKNNDLGLVRKWWFYVLCKSLKNNNLWVLWNPIMNKSG